MWGLRSAPALDDSTDLIDIPSTCSDSSPELIPAAVGLCSTFCLDEEAEASVTVCASLHAVAGRRCILRDVTSDCHCRAENDALLHCITAYAR